MDNLDKELHRLSRIEPSKGFLKASRERLMFQIELDKQEGWLKSFLRRYGKVSISDAFLAQARQRLMDRVTHLPQPIRIPLRGFALFLSYTKKAVASTLVMAIAVTATLFFVEGNSVVEASDDSYLEVLSGTVEVKHPDLLVWEQVEGVMQVQAGDVIKVEEGSEAVIRFFDDTELRLGAGSQLLISQLMVSPVFGGQGIIETSLHTGSAWVQTLNVDDGYAGFALYTRDALLKTIKGTYSVSAGFDKPTSVLVLDNKIDLTLLRSETREPLESKKLPANQKATVQLVNGAPVLLAEPTDEQDLASEWVQRNLKEDDKHLAVLRENGIRRLTQMAGTLPGQMLYPIKQAKERLELAFSSDADLSLQIEIANRRLNEALVLFETGDRQKGEEALAAYQNMARQIAEAKGAKELPVKLTNRLIVPHQKILTAELPNDVNTGLVKEALHQTAEILAENPVDLETVRLTNSVQRLADVAALVEQGDLLAAKERLINQSVTTGDTLQVVETIEDETLKKETLEQVLELRQEELALLASLTEKLDAAEATEQEGIELAAMLSAAAETAKMNVETTLAAAQPLLPEVQEQPVVRLSSAELRLAKVVDKISLYNTWQGQQNQIERLLGNDLKNPKSVDYLKSVSNQLDGRAHDYLNARILQLERVAELQKHKAMQRKIERSQRLREN